MRTILANTLSTVFLATLTVVTVLPWNGVVFIAWLCTFTPIPGIDANKSQLAYRLVQIVLYVGLVLVAFISPVKRGDSNLKESVVLPKLKLTLNDLETMANTTDGPIPIRLSVTCPDKQRNTPIHFARRNLTLGELVNCIELQMPITHRFHHCGNAYTILWGYPPSYWLRLVESS